MSTWRLYMLHEAERTMILMYEAGEVEKMEVWQLRPVHQRRILRKSHRMTWEDAISRWQMPVTSALPRQAGVKLTRLGQFGLQQTPVANLALLYLGALYKCARLICGAELMPCSLISFQCVKNIPFTTSSTSTSSHTALHRTMPPSI